jgi:hypothetical protein
MITAEEAVKYGRGDWRSFDCPVHRASHPTARINAYNLRWVCMSCGAKGKMSDIEIDEDKQLEYINKLLEPKMQMTIYEAELDMYDIEGPGEYWLSRFSPEACAEFRLGHDGDYPTYPVRDEGGNLLGIVRRNPYGERPKYRYPSGVNLASNYLFGYEKVSQKVVLLVEGAPDVIAAWEVGVDALGSYGDDLSARQISLIGRLSPLFVAVAYDDDEAGQKASRKAVRRLLEAGIMAFPLGLGGYHDLADIPLDLRYAIIRESLDSKDTIDYLLTHG